MAPLGKIYSYPNNLRVQKILIAAKYAGVQIEEAKDFQMGVTNKSAEFLAKFPLGKVPAFEGSDGFTLFESNAIAHYVAASSSSYPLLGKTPQENAKVQQYIFFCDNEIAPVAASWLLPIFGYVPFNKDNTEKAKTDFKRALNVLDTILLNKTFLVGESVTLADITVCCALLNFYKTVLTPEYRQQYKNVDRWIITLVNQPNFKSVFGEVQFCTKEAQPDLSKKVDAKGMEKKETKKSEKEARPASAKKEKPVAKKADMDVDDDDEHKEAAPKEKNPLDLLPPSKLNLENWKRFYSNNDTRPTAINWFWDNFDSEGFSIWRVTYKYNSELTLVFMSSNLIGGFFQRLERVRKYAFGSLVVLGEDKKNEITGYFVFRGQGIPQEVQDAADFDSYDFKKVDSKDSKIRESFNAFIAWDDIIEGKKFADGKIFK